FDSVRFDKNMKATSFQGLSQQYFPLSVLYHATITRDLDFTKYNEDATEEKFTIPLSVALHPWLMIPIGTCLEKHQVIRHIEKIAAEIKKQKKARFDEDKIWMDKHMKKHRAVSNYSWEESLESKDKEE
ncbi:11388_t:CDS:2, partial [Racocetra fulgida]